MIKSEKLGEFLWDFYMKSYICMILFPDFNTILNPKMLLFSVSATKKCPASKTDKF